MALTTAFARNGNRKAVPQSTADGSVSYEQGFGNLYALPPEEGGLFIDRAQFNQIMYDTTSAVISNQNSISTLNSKVTANQNSINTLNSKVADLESGVSTGVVNLTGNQTIAGVKTFSSPPVSATNPTANNQVANKAYVDTVGNTAVKLTGNQTIAGTKTFSSPVVVPDATATTHAVNLAQLNTKANWNAVVNLTGNQTIEGVKTFSSIPVSATQPTNANQVANKAYVDAIAAKKANFITATVKIGANEAIKNLNEFRTFTQRNFANYYVISLTSDIEVNANLNFSGLRFTVSPTTYKIKVNANIIISDCSIAFGNINFEFGAGSSSIMILSSCLFINGDVNVTDNAGANASDYLFLIGNSKVSLGPDDSWVINTPKTSVFELSGGSSLAFQSINFSGSIGGKLVGFLRPSLLFTSGSTFNNLTVTDIAQNQLTNKGIWFNS